MQREHLLFCVVSLETPGGQWSALEEPDTDTKILNITNHYHSHAAQVKLRELLKEFSRHGKISDSKITP